MKKSAFSHGLMTPKFIPMTEISSEQKTCKQKACKQKAWVVFSTHTDLPWLKFLKSGFRHCFVLLHDGQGWISIDPLSAYMEVQSYPHLGARYDLPQWLVGQGYHVVRADINTRHKKSAPAMVFTCVEAIKRILGIHRRFIVTPWQLYRFLEKQNKHQTKHQTQNVKGKLSWAA